MLMCVLQDDVFMGLFSSVFFCKIRWWRFFVDVGFCLFVGFDFVVFFIF